MSVLRAHFVDDYRSSVTHSEHVSIQGIGNICLQSRMWENVNISLGTDACLWNVFVALMVDSRISGLDCFLILVLIFIYIKVNLLFRVIRKRLLFLFNVVIMRSYFDVKTVHLDRNIHIAANTCVAVPINVDTIDFCLWILFYSNLSNINSGVCFLLFYFRSKVTNSHFEVW